MFRCLNLPQVTDPNNYSIPLTQSRVWATSKPRNDSQSPKYPFGKCCGSDEDESCFFLPY